MASNQESKVYKKGEIIINPKTQRPVKVGGRIWLKLVREGLLVGECKDDNEIYTVQEEDNIEQKIQEFNKSLPPNQHAVRGRGKYANKIVKRHKQPNIIDTTKHTVKTTARKIKDRDVYEDLQEGGNFEEDLEALIMTELMNITNERYEPFTARYSEDEEEEAYDEEDKEEEGDFSDGSFE